MADALPAQPSAAYLAESQQAAQYAAFIAPLPFTLFTVGGRLWCRRKNRAGLWVDDYLVIFALVLLLVTTGRTLYSVVHGLGRHIQALGPDAAEVFYITEFIDEITYTFIVISTKWAVLALCWRIFGRAIKWEAIILAGIVTLWGFSLILVELLSCLPLQKYWARSMPGVCGVDETAFFLSITIPNFVFDVVILAIPVRHVLKLHLKTHVKIVVTGCFLTGGLVCIASICRMVTMIQSDLNSPDPTWAFSPNTVWATLECNFSIISACLPCLHPLYCEFSILSAKVWPCSIFTSRTAVESGTAHRFHEMG